MPLRKPVTSSRGPGQFPRRWNLYQPGWTRKYQIGEHQDAPAFAVMPYMGWFGKARMTLHADSHKKSAVVAKVKKPSFTFHNRNGSRSSSQQETRKMISWNSSRRSQSAS